MKRLFGRLATLVLLSYFSTQPSELHAKGDILRALPAEQISSLSQDTLKFLGEGTFRYLGVKLYTARFYLDPTIRDSRQALTDAPKHLVIRYLRDIPKKALVEAAEKNIRNNPSADFKMLEKRVDQMHEQFVDLKKNDVYELVYFRGKTFLYYNGDLRAQIDGADFSKAYFGIWLSEYSISQKLRKNLLGIHR